MKEIAELLGKSINTLRRQLNSVKYKLRAENRTHAIAIAVREGLIE